MTIRDAAGSRAAKAKGRAAETAVVEYLRSVGIPAERRRLTGVADCGDLAGWHGVVCEVKSCKKMDLAGWIDELTSECLNADKRWPESAPHRGVLVIKRRGHSDPKHWYWLVHGQQAVDTILGNAPYEAELLR